MVRRLEEKGFGFRSLTVGIDTTTASGSIVFPVFGVLVYCSPQRIPLLHET